MNKVNSFGTCSFIIFLALTMFSAVPAYAQPSAGKFGLGIQFGDPSGLSMRIYQPSKMSVDILLAWDLNDFFYANVHGTWEKPLGDTGNFKFFYGPGLFLGFRDRGNGRVFEGNDEVTFGVSGTAGFNVYIDRVEIYVRITPRLSLYNRTEGAMGGGLGFRFYL